MIFDLAELIQQVPLPVMDDPFSNEEIKAALIDMPSDHAPWAGWFQWCIYEKLLAYY